MRDARARVDRCPVDVFVASDMPYEYPYKLVKPDHVSPTVAESADCLLMDSGIGDDTTNEEVLDLAATYDADFVVPCDELHDVPATVAAIHDFMARWQTHECRATPLIPLQPDHVECYRRLEDTPPHVMLGGLAFDASATEIITAIERFRREVGMGPTVHLLGAGASQRLVAWLGDNPGLVQSLDCSTPEQAVINGKAYDMTLSQTSFEMLSGDGSSLSRYGLARELAYILNDAITHAERTTTTQTTLVDAQEVSVDG